MASVTLALLDESLPQQLQTNPQPDLQIAWRGTSLVQLKTALTKVKAQVLILDLELLGEDPVREIESLRQASGADLVITIYKFARRQLVHDLSGEGKRAIKAPISVDALRAQLMSVLIRSIFDEDPTPARSDPSAELHRQSLRGNQSQRGNADPPPVRFTSAQLGRLAEIASSVACECPNHVSTLVASLQAFEAYSKKCESRDDADRAVHRRLYEQTGRARALMEEALQMLLEHEKISV